MNQKFTKNILQRFSCFLVGEGKKNCGHKFLLESLFILRQNDDLTRSLKNRNVELKSLQSRNKKIDLYHQLKTIRQFLCLSPVSQEQPEEMQQQTAYTYPDHSQSLNKVAAAIAVAVASQKQKQNQKQQVTSKVDKQYCDIKQLLSKIICLYSVENVKPILETRKIRKGRVTYKVPLVTSSHRQEGKAIALLIENANLRKTNEIRRSDLSQGIMQHSDNNRFNNKKASSVSSPMTSANEGITSHVDNKNNYIVPLLYIPEAIIDKSLVDTSRNRDLLILPPYSLQNKQDRFFHKRKNNNGVISDATSGETKSVIEDATKGGTSGKIEDDTSHLSPRTSSSKMKGVEYCEISGDDAKQYSLQSKSLSKLDIDKNIFLTLPEKKHFLTFLRKPNIKYRLSEELSESRNGKGESIENRKRLHKIALQNRAYQHFRWW